MGPQGSRQVALRSPVQQKGDKEASPGEEDITGLDVQVGNALAVQV